MSRKERSECVEWFRDRTGLRVRIRIANRPVVEGSWNPLFLVTVPNFMNL